MRPLPRAPTGLKWQLKLEPPVSCQFVPLRRAPMGLKWQVKLEPPVTCQLRPLLRARMGLKWQLGEPHSGELGVRGACQGQCERQEPAG